MVSVAFLVSLVLVAVVDDRLGRSVMVAVALSALIRGALLVRSVRRPGGMGEPSA